MTQFHQWFITLNEVTEVVAWRLPKSTAFSEIEDFHTELKKRTSQEEIQKSLCASRIVVMSMVNTSSFKFFSVFSLR